MKNTLNCPICDCPVFSFKNGRVFWGRMVCNICKTYEIHVGDTIVTEVRYFDKYIIKIFIDQRYYLENFDTNSPETIWDVYPRGFQKQLLATGVGAIPNIRTEEQLENLMML